MAQGNNYQQSDAGPSEYSPPLSDPQITPHSFNMLAGQGQVENFEDIFHLLSNVELRPPYAPPPPQPFPSPHPPPKTSDQISHGRSETQKKTTQDNSRRKRPSEAHNLMERRRRTKIQERLNTLQQLLPNCNKTDRVSILSDVIEHIKSLQKQVEVMNTLGIPVMPPYLSGGGGGQQTMQMPYFPPHPHLVPMAPMGVYPSYSTAFTVSPTFLPSGPHPPFHMYPPATSLTTTRAHDVGCATVNATTLTTANNIQQMLHMFQARDQRKARCQLCEIVRPSFRGNNPCSWVMDDND